MKMKMGSQRRTVARTAGRKCRATFAQFVSSLSLFQASSPHKMGRCVTKAKKKKIDFLTNQSKYATDAN